MGAGCAKRQRTAEEAALEHMRHVRERNPDLPTAAHRGYPLTWHRLEQSMMGAVFLLQVVRYMEDATAARLYCLMRKNDRTAVLLCENGVSSDVYKHRDLAVWGQDAFTVLDLTLYKRRMSLTDSGVLPQVDRTVYNTS